MTTNDETYYGHREHAGIDALANLVIMHTATDPEYMQLCHDVLAAQGVHVPAEDDEAGHRQYVQEITVLNAVVLGRAISKVRFFPEGD